ncbi:MAG: 30S ribosomal protein S2 [Candidatus Amesbacteria bacterium GW2011_GWB1_47_26]|uniref:Small ribosomal subunit protein uS2 n=1 Tax=Candidatus Amesbacteria bacterium GW2011_GWC2_45_19 TaxID=1618366 RepID=A0A0G1PAV9_9BACT|nr:MAG: 30S ribosomal protein S2 [Candidatus Amesbacteria bacterium GW2011_GWC2_45_19]KKU37933.1 MAG: 30S ribosomal protein S2 [Candidatus Amesbacteria bacterium GW2011_GWA1_46_35]KKU69035.1 MAG: 30S ribosomal protein S2 [Microgenomates group bacterium GW2011_GWC1_47_20]KKU74721.1 MAG: 30S ribosomal protein S2 [Candidatus Amesbacteria bacterium GW2011_GWB1_47_26]KKU79774.1 MAG: 30S ribosomal protein S2 [Candidatus Amesbacteria bacterium GW2011_GWA2_47_70]
MSDITLQQLLEAGCHFGHQARRWNPAMKKYIYGERDGVHIFDLVQTKAGLNAAVELVKKLAKDGKIILCVGTKRQAQEAVKREAMRVGMPYVTQRWLGGMLTNFAQMQKRVYKLKDLKAKRESGELKKYTKREQLLIDREIAQLEKFLGGVADMGKLPDALLVVDTHREEVAVREANKMGIPVVGMVDTNGDPARVDYIIPVNDDAVKSIELVVKAVASAIKK